MCNRFLGCFLSVWPGTRWPCRWFGWVECVLLWEFRVNFCISRHYFIDNYGFWTNFMDIVFAIVVEKCCWFFVFCFIMIVRWGDVCIDFMCGFRLIGATAIKFNEKMRGKLIISPFDFFIYFCSIRLAWRFIEIWNEKNFNFALCMDALGPGVIGLESKWFDSSITLFER